MDTFIERVLTVEKQQDVEATKARELGTRIHAAIKSALVDGPYDMSLTPFVTAATNAVGRFGLILDTESIVVGDGYAGTLDVKLKNDVVTVVDFKSSKKLSDKSYLEHRLQLCAYAAAVKEFGAVQTANIYISTTEPGAVSVCVNTDWQDTYERGFKPLLKYWSWANGYQP